MTKYEHLIDIQQNIVKETCTEYASLNERHIQVIWLEQKYFRPLKTHSGKSIEVVSPGIWNAEEGPDFKKAYLIIDGEDYFGDVEIHLSDQGWKQHEHHLDSNYNNVIFHLSLWNSASNKEIITQNNKKIESGYLQDSLTISHKRIMQLIDLDLYPYKKFCGTGQCAEKLFKNLSQIKTIELFQDASEWRLLKKKERLEARIEHPELYFSAGIAMALGYKKNTEPFIDLFLKLINNTKLTNDQLLAMGMNLFGYFNDYYLKYWEHSPYYNELHRLAKEIESINTSQSPLYLAHIRPINHPIRRIVYLIHLIKDPRLFYFLSIFEKCWNDNWMKIKTKKEQKDFLIKLSSLIPSYIDTYWSYHYTFESKPQNKLIPLIGNPLKTEIIINTLLPLIHTSISERENFHEMQAFFDFYSTIKSQESQKSKYLKQRFFGNGTKGDLLKKANLLQGAYQIHHDFCVHYESSCKGCPFVEKYKNYYE